MALEEPLTTSEHGTIFVDVSHITDGHRITVAGDIDINTLDQFSRPLRAAVETSRVVEIDLAEVTFMDSQGLRALLQAASPNHHRVEVVALSRQVLHLLEATATLPILAPRLSAAE